MKNEIREPKAHKGGRQGEVLCRPIAEVPNKAKPIPREGGAIVLSRGSSTQHSHRITEKGAMLYGVGDGFAQRRYLELPKAATLECERHPSFALAAGVYEVVLHREFSGDVARTVAD